MRTLVLLMAALFLAAGLASAPAQAIGVQQEMKVGFIYISPIGEGGWSYAHDQARKFLSSLPGVTTSYVAVSYTHLDVYKRQGVTSLMLPAGVDGDKLLKVAADECGIVFAGGQDHYKGRMVRFGHMGWVDWADALAGLHALAHGLRASGGFSASRDYLETALSAYHRALDVEPGRVIPDVRS